MKHLLILVSMLALAYAPAFTQGLQVGDKAPDFKLKNVDGKMVSLRDFPQAKGFVVIFTCNHCPYAKAYQDRIIEIDKKFKLSGYPVIAINPNDPQIEPEDSYDNMVIRAKDKGFTFPYLFDEKQEVYKQYGAKRTPHVFLLAKKDNVLFVRYIGAIDDNYQDESKVTSYYLADAIKAIIAGRDPESTFTKAIGCTIKDKNYQK